MKNKLYDLYLKSPEWKAISDECKRLANFKCNRCDNTTNLHAHHLTYDNIGEEKQEDLECLCLSCHEEEHQRDAQEHGRPARHHPPDGPAAARVRAAAEGQARAARPGPRHLDGGA